MPLRTTAVSSPAAFGMHEDVGNPAHQVFTEAYLRVHDPTRRQVVARGEIVEMRRNRRRSNIDRETAGVALEARPDRDDTGLVMHGDRHLPVALAQQRLQ